ncbi:hypothetical protein BTR14_02110 [Rhizobium rhizosphaerae]|uniref:Uncharacterized protein n=1 Tax=Xaviernesmea rhizosphaerae TaxID=1672749 RepID=A0ABX3PJM0_9HYPH|nr:hypothetical protein [Xaviernesmea rhizosphaerae]OQP88263.1 hypothetical protein BTR14_02110 [Xaviernesmea rhizosphaerae]
MNDNLETGLEVDVEANSAGAHVYGNMQINTNKGSKDCWAMYGQSPGPTDAYHLSLKTEIETPYSDSTNTGYIAASINVALDANATCAISIQRQWAYRRFPATALPS